MPGVNDSATNNLTLQNNGSGDCGVNKLYVTAEETQIPEEAKIEGKIPSYITGGKYLRVGPCKFDFNQFTMTHFLDGYAMLTKFEIKDDSITLEKKYVQSDAYKRAIAHQKPVVNEFNTKAHTDEKKGFFARVISTLVPEFTDNSYSTLFQVGQDVFATCDTQFFHKINPGQISVECKCDANKLFGVNGHCAHPITDRNGDVFNIGFTVGATGLKYHLFKMPFGKSSDEMMKKSQIITTMSPRWTGQMGTTHSFGMTENYLVFVEQPYTVSAKRIAASFVRGDTLFDWLEWRPDEKNRFYIIEKNSGKVWKTEFLTTKAFYFMHFVNCYEESNQIVVDIITYDSPHILSTMLIKKLRSNSDGTHDLPFVQRFVVPLISDIKAGNIRENLNLVSQDSFTGSGRECTAFRKGNKILITGETICGYGMDLPTTNKRFFGRKTRYVYATGTLHKHHFTHTVCKVDLDSKEVWRWKLNDFTYPGEPYFVPDPKGTREDDGVLIFGLTDRRLGHNDFLIVLDARNLKELGRAQFNGHIPSSLHGIFIPN